MSGRGLTLDGWPPRDATTLDEVDHTVVPDSASFEPHREYVANSAHALSRR
jgi:hypothetical protein